MNFIRSSVSVHEHFETDSSVLYPVTCLYINKLTRGNDAIVRFVFIYSFRVKILVNYNCSWKGTPDKITGRGIR